MSQQQVFSDRYELVRHVARGGMAQVYLARDILLDRPVALKVLFPELSVDPSFVQRFRAEAKAAANLSHPNIVAVYDWGQGERTYFIVMEFVDGSTLSQLIRQTPLDPHRAAVIGADVAAALDFAHQRGVIHRDVKPGNVLIDRSGQVKVADFGIARAVGAAEGLTQAGSVMGTATYFSPEQAQGHMVDARSDVYSLGVVLYEMVAGHPPFTGDNPVAIAYKHVREQPTPLSQVRPEVPRAYEAIVARAMAKDPADRYQTAGGLRADLLRFSQGQAVLATGYPTTVVAPVGNPPVGNAPVGNADATRVQRPADGTLLMPGGGVAAGRSGGGAGTGAGAARLDAPADRAGPPPGGVGGGPVDAAGDLERSRTRLFVGVLVGLLVVLAVLLFFLGRQVGLFGSSAGSNKTIPADIVGKTYAAAQTELGNLGFARVSQTGGVSDSMAVGSVISSTPAAGTKTSTAAPVTLLVSTGPTSVQVPDVTDKSQADATAELRAAGFIVNVGSPQNSATVTQGLVITTQPAPGSQAAKGSAVQLILSAGKQQVPIPSVVGKDGVTASNALGQLHFNVVTQNEPSSTYRAGLVTRTNPPAGTSAPVDSTITLYVSTGAQVPNVVGLTRAAATQAIANAGLAASTSTQPVTDPTQVGVVIAQNPPAASSATPGSSVSVVVGSPAPTTTTSTTVTTVPATTTTSTTAPPG